MICNRCGNNLPDNSTFCPFCGNTLTAEAPQAYAYQPAAAQYAAPVQEQYVVAEPEAPKKKKGKGSPVVAIILAVVAIAFAGVAVWQFLAGQELTAQLDAAAEDNAALAEENASLEDEVSAQKTALTNLESDFSTLTEEYNALETEHAGSADRIADLESQVADKEGTIDELSAYVLDLESALSSAEVSVDIYNTVHAYMYSDEVYDYFEDDYFFTYNNVVVVPVGGSAYIFAYFGRTGSIYYEWDGNYVTCEGQGFTDNMCPILVTGLAPGVCEIVFTNNVDSVTFSVLAVVV